MLSGQTVMKNADCISSARNERPLYSLYYFIIYINLRSTHFSSGLMALIFVAPEFLGSLSTNPSSKFRNCICWILYRGPKCKTVLDWDEIRYSGVFGVTDCDSKLEIQKYKMADPISWTKV